MESIRSGVLRTLNLLWNLLSCLLETPLIQKLLIAGQASVCFQVRSNPNPKSISQALQHTHHVTYSTQLLDLLSMALLHWTLGTQRTRNFAPPSHRCGPLWPDMMPPSSLIPQEVDQILLLQSLLQLFQLDSRYVSYENSPFRRPLTVLGYQPNLIAIGNNYTVIRYTSTIILIKRHTTCRTCSPIHSFIHSFLVVAWPCSMPAPQLLITDWSTKASGFENRRSTFQGGWWW